MKKIILWILIFTYSLSFCACTPVSSSDTITYNDDLSEWYYNGHTYINYNNTNGKYITDRKDLEWVEIATIPYGIFYILGAVTIFYGNDKENPEFITNSRTIDFYVRDDLTLDHNSELSLCDADAPFSFKISEVTTDSIIQYTVDQQDRYTEICDFFAYFTDYPCVKLRITICEYNGNLYLQDCWDSDYFLITEEFKADIYRLGLTS